MRHTFVLTSELQHLIMARINCVYKNNNCTINYWIKLSKIITGMLKCHLKLKRGFKNSDVRSKTIDLQNKIHTKILQVQKNN